VIYICIPAHNEEKTIGLLLWKIRTVLVELARDFEIVVLQDACTDGTGDTLDRYRRVLPLRVLRTDEPLGYARAVEALLRDVTKRAGYPKRDIVVTLQGDFSENPEDMVGLIKTIEGGADLVAGVPDGSGQPAPRPVRWARWWAPKVMGQSWRGAPVTDPSTGFRAYRVVVLRKLLAAHTDTPLMSQDGWAANVELLSLAAPHARRIEEEPFAVNHAIKQRATRFQAFRTVCELFRLRGAGWWVPTRSES